jgi:hypothetical protein
MKTNGDFLRNLARRIVERSRARTRLPVERWRDGIGWEGHLQASNLGRLRSIPRKGRRTAKILTQRFGGREGYKTVYIAHLGMKNRTRMVHKLVADAWLGPCPPGQRIYHNSGVLSDNSVTNLSYGPPKREYILEESKNA